MFLDALTGIGLGLLVRHGCAGKALDSYLQSSLVHHMKHDSDALALFSDQDAFAGPFSPSASEEVALAWMPISLNPRDVHIIPFAQVAFIVEEKLGNQEDTETPGTSRRPRKSGEDQMCDVFGEIVIATADEDLFSGQVIDTGLIGRNRLGSIVAH